MDLSIAFLCSRDEGPFPLAKLFTSRTGVSSPFESLSLVLSLVSRLLLFRFFLRLFNFGLELFDRVGFGDDKL